MNKNSDNKTNICLLNTSLSRYDQNGHTLRLSYDLLAKKNRVLSIDIVSPSCPYKNDYSEITISAAFSSLLISLKWNQLLTKLLNFLKDNACKIIVFNDPKLLILLNEVSACLGCKIFYVGEFVDELILYQTNIETNKFQSTDLRVINNYLSIISSLNQIDTQKLCASFVSCEYLSSCGLIYLQMLIVDKSDSTIEDFTSKLLKNIQVRVSEHLQSGCKVLDLKKVNISPRLLLLKISVICEFGTDLNNASIVGFYLEDKDEKIVFDVSNCKDYIVKSQILNIENNTEDTASIMSWHDNFKEISISKRVVSVKNASEEEKELIDKLLPRSESISEIKQFKNKYLNESVWILGNGPSVQAQELEKLIGRRVVCFNRFYLANSLTNLKATFTVSADEQMISDFGEEIVSRSHGHVFLASAQNPKLRNQNYCWLRQVVSYPSPFSTRPDMVVSSGASSVYVALQLAWYMGFRRFYLYGHDFNFTYKFDPNSTEIFESASGDNNHFIENYRSGLDWCPPELKNIWSSFAMARIFIEANGGEIINVTPGGNLNMFKRSTFNSCLSKY